MLLSFWEPRQVQHLSFPGIYLYQRCATTVYCQYHRHGLVPRHDIAINDLCQHFLDWSLKLDVPPLPPEQVGQAKDCLIDQRAKRFHHVVGKTVWISHVIVMYAERALHSMSDKTPRRRRSNERIRIIERRIWHGIHIVPLGRAHNSQTAEVPGSRHRFQVAHIPITHLARPIPHPRPIATTSPPHVLRLVEYLRRDNLLPCSSGVPICNLSLKDAFMASMCTHRGCHADRNLA